MSKRASIVASFGHAMDGLKTAFKQEPNFRIHTSFALTAIVFAMAIRISRIEWVILLFTITFVLILELINTMVESLVDLVQPKYHEKAKLAKDVSASVVMLGAAISIVVGISIFLPRLFELAVLINSQK